MNRLSGHHKYLLMGKITQTLSDAETAELDNVFLKNDEIRALYNDLLQLYPEEWVKNGFEHLDDPNYWDRFNETISPVTPAIRPRIWLKRLSVAAVSIGIAMGGWWYSNYSASSEKEKVQAITQKANVQLELASGEVINLNERKGDISTRSGRFSNDKNSLKYSSTNTTVNGINKIVVPAAMNYSIVLNDGSEIFLNSMTQLKFPSVFSESHREIWVSGEAYLKIARNPAKPFFVHLPESTVEVLGTEFNVNSYDSGIVRVALVNGSIKMKSSTNSVRVFPGNEATYTNGKGINQRNFDAKIVLGWRHGLYYYDQVGLKELSKIIERCFNAKSVIDNPALYKKVFVGVIDTNQPLQSILDDLQGMSNISTTIDAKGVLHFK
jgi:hypothetical protein